MKKSFALLTILFFCFIVCQCKTLTSDFVNVENPDDLKGLWGRADLSYIEYPIERDGTTYMAVYEKLCDDTKLWCDFADLNDLTFEDVWARKFALISKIYSKEYPLVNEDGVQSGLKLSLTGDKKVYSKFTTLIPIDLLFEGQYAPIISHDKKSLYFNRKLYSK